MVTPSSQRRTLGILRGGVPWKTLRWSELIWVSTYFIFMAKTRGKAVFRRKVTRKQLIEFFATLHACTVVMEACAGAHHMARKLAAFGHQVLRRHYLGRARRRNGLGQFSLDGLGRLVVLLAHGKRGAQDDRMATL